MFECKFLLIHLSYYIIAHYVKLVALQSDVEDGELPVTFSERYEWSNSCTIRQLM